MCEYQPCTPETAPDYRISRRRLLGAGLALAMGGGVVLSQALPSDSLLALPSSNKVESLPVPDIVAGYESRKVTDDLEIVTRNNWAQGLNPTSEMSPEDVKFLLVHHSAGSNSYSIESVPNILRGIFSHHTENKGWPDVAYNFFIDRAGVVYEGRQGSLDGPVVASATGGNQGFAQLVCLLGDFTSALPSEAMEQSLIKLLAWNADRFGIATDPNSQVSFVSRGANKPETAEGKQVTLNPVAAHYQVSSTECPGLLFRPYVADGTLQTLVHKRRASSPGSQAPEDQTETTDTGPFETFPVEQYPIETVPLPPVTPREQFPQIPSQTSPTTRQTLPPEIVIHTPPVERDSQQLETDESKNNDSVPTNDLIKKGAMAAAVVGTAIVVVDALNS